MSVHKGVRSTPRRNCPPAATNCRRPSEQQNSCRYGASAEKKKTRSIQSLQESLFFTLKRPRTRRHRHLSGLKKAHSSHAHRPAGNSTLMESGLIQIPYLQNCDYYESPSPLSISSGGVANSVTFIASTAATSSISTSTSASSSITYATARHSPVSAHCTSSDDSFSCDEVMSLVSSCCPDMAMPYALDFMPQSERCAAAAIDHPAPSLLSAISSDQAIRTDCPASSVDDDAEPYNIDLRDFEPDVNSLSSPPQDCASHSHRYGGGVLCLRLDHAEVLKAWKEKQQECHASEKSIYYPAPHLDPLHIFEYYPLIPHPAFF